MKYKIKQIIRTIKMDKRTFYMYVGLLKKKEYSTLWFRMKLDLEVVVNILLKTFNFETLIDRSIRKDQERYSIILKEVNKHLHYQVKLLEYEQSSNFTYMELKLNMFEKYNFCMDSFGGCFVKWIFNKKGNKTGKYTYNYDGTWEYINGTFYFKNPDDATLFKLRWSE